MGMISNCIYYTGGYYKVTDENCGKVGEQCIVISSSSEAVASNRKHGGFAIYFIGFRHQCN